MTDQVRRFLSGAVSGTVTAAILQPLDVIKTTQQGQQLLRDAAVEGVATSAKRPRGVLQTASTLVKTEGALSLWKGLNATIVRVFFGAGLYFVSLHAITDAIGASSTHGGLSSFVAGAAARSLAAAVLSPVSVVKTRLEWAASGRSPYKGTVHALRTIATSEGLASLYSGLLPTIVRDAPFSGLYFAFYSRLKPATATAIERLAGGKSAKELEYANRNAPVGAWEALDPGGAAAAHPATGLPAAAALAPVSNFTAGLLAGAAATLITHPADVVKTRLQMRDAKGRFVDGAVLLAEVRSLMADRGAAAFLVGAGARVAKRAAQTAITWTLFEEAMRRSSGG